MAQQDYTYVMNIILNDFEGGYGWDRNDPGGPTKWGITCYDLAEYLHQTMNSMAEWAPKVEAMTLATADAIYLKKYNPAVNFNNLVPGSDFAMIDFDINSGVTAVELAQKIVGVTVDGVCGPITTAAINNMAASAFIGQLCDARLLFLESLSIWPDFKNGWTSRVNEVRKLGLELATNHGPPANIPLRTIQIWKPKLSAKGYKE